MTCCATTFCQNDSTRYVDSSDEKGGVNVLAVVDPRLVLDGAEAGVRCHSAKRGACPTSALRQCARHLRLVHG